ncbi:MAG: hypothetical protein KJ955_07185 [Nanoarchaeota archaeon]|nr:hypothetical protein [Nanoarchaeota archaeon]
MNWAFRIETIEGELHRDFLRMAYQIGEDNSQDPVTHTGAIIVAQDFMNVVGKAANHFPPGFDIPEGLESETARKARLEAIIHAEPSAVHDAARHSGGTNNATMYMPWAPCYPCSKVIADSGITMLVMHKQLLLMTSDKTWTAPEYKMERAFDTLKDAGVRVCMYDGKIGGVKHLYKGEVWEP